MVELGSAAPAADRGAGPSLAPLARPTHAGRPLRVGLVAPPWAAVPPVGYGGTELMVDRLARALREAGHDVRLAATGDSTCPVTRHVTLPRAEGQRMGASLTEARHVLAAYEVLDGCDVIHDHTLAGPLLAAGRADVPPVVTTNHGPFAGDLLDYYRRLGGAAPVIAISRSQAAAARGVDIVAVIHHGLDVGRVPVGAGDGGYACFLGRMAPEKGPHRAADAARAAGVPLKIAAKMREPEERAYFDAQVRPRLGGDVEYVGELADTDKQRLLAGAVALLNPIRWREPFGLVMVEALAAGTPVLAFPEGAAPEIVEHGVTGFLCDDVAAMAAALAGAGALDRRRCRRAAADRFSARRMADDHVGVYRKLVAAARVTTGTATA